jgi:methylthioribulose-1-phosphate dehydratase
VASIMNRSSPNALDSRSPDERFGACAHAIAEAARELAERGWTPATSSNFSMRLAPERVAITISGRDKGRLSEDDIMLVDLDGQPVGSAARPSAETLLHTQLYRHDPSIGAVLHTHSRTQTVASRLYAPAGLVRFAGYELQKAFEGHTTHEGVIDLPVFPNSQDIPALAQTIEDWLEGGPGYGYLIDGHGMYAWGRDMAAARRHLEAFDFLLACELDLKRLRT